MNRINSPFTRNILFLTLWQGSVYIIPLILLPYLSRTLGVEGFGYFALALALAAALSLIPEWGFSLTGTQKVSQRRDEPAELVSVFWSVMTAKIVLLVISLSFLFALIFTMPGWRPLLPILSAIVPHLLTSGINANWFLQGMERMGLFTASALAGRLLAIPMTIVLVKTPDDLSVAILIQGMSGLISAIFSLILATRVLGQWRHRVRLRAVLGEITGGFQVFLSTSSVSLYTQLNVVILASVSGSAQAGLLGGADRLRRAAQGITGPVVMAFFPKINRAFALDPTGARLMMLRFLAFQTAVHAGISVLLWLFAPVLVEIVLGPAYSDAVVVLRVLALAPFFVGISNAVGINMLIPIGLRGRFTFVIMTSALFNIALILPLCLKFGALGAAGCLVFTEALVAAMMSFLLFTSPTWRDLGRPSPTASLPIN